ncbi:molybdenum cofactor biosynthesis protein MoaA [Bacillus manliponensis]|uniref:Molybdenum cofactor biosynthesis protein MoaA n=1 Tax=Bacillus manliponensis TaxID=574376 RepID=A0A073JXM0_9BACI|nr:sporulation membrane protein YtrI [Bacillus manliponensis]KEK18932.1 molybdenum cofactor biosynthesis protein MoaA [Bacillus manliponensis]
MRVPTASIARRWYLFLAGTAVGSILGWVIFLYIYGVFQENQTVTIEKQRIKIEQLEEDLHILTEDRNKLNEDNKRLLTIQEIKVEIINPEKYDLDSFTVESITTSIEDDLRHLLTKHVNSVAQNKELLKKTIEHKVYNLYDRAYQFDIETIYFDTTVEISVKIKQKKDK